MTDAESAKVQANVNAYIHRQESLARLHALSVKTRKEHRAMAEKAGLQYLLNSTIARKV
jgi:hypothetical protein